MVAIRNDKNLATHTGYCTIREVYVKFARLIIWLLIILSILLLYSLIVASQCVATTV